MGTGVHRRKIRLPRVIILMAALLCLCSTYNASSQIYSGGGDIRVNEGWGDTLGPHYTIDELSRFMYLAVSKGQDKEVLRLIQEGADINARDQGGRTFLIWASMGGHDRIARILIDAGADVNATSSGHEITSLLAASAKGHAEIVKMLIHAGADINVKGFEETTPLMIASANDHEQVVRILIDAGAHLEAQNEFGKTALKLALDKDHDNIVKILKRAGARGDWLWISLLYSIILGVVMFVVIAVFSAVGKNGGYKRLILWSAGIAVADMCCNLTFGGWIPYFIHEFRFWGILDRSLNFPWGVWYSFLMISLGILVEIRTACDFKWSWGRSYVTLFSILALTLFTSYHAGKILPGGN